jgi:hypothetical protein
MPSTVGPPAGLSFARGWATLDVRFVEARGGREIDRMESAGLFYFEKVTKRSPR